MIRFSIRSVLLLTMLVALVLTGLRRGEQTEQLKKLASDLRLVGRELDVTDPTYIYAVQVMPEKVPNAAVDFYVPAKGRYVLRLEDKNIGRAKIDTHFKSVPLDAGFHQLRALLTEPTRSAGWSVKLELDKASILERKFAPEKWVEVKNFDCSSPLKPPRQYGPYPGKYAPTDSVQLFHLELYDERAFTLLPYGTLDGLNVRLERIAVWDQK